MKRYYTLFAILNTAAFLGMLITNILANVLPINGVTTGQMSAMYPSLFTPSGITFSIWGLIYLLLLASMVYQFVVVTGKKEYRKRFIGKLSLLFIVNSLLNIGWILSWHYHHIHISVLIMLLLLFNLILIYRRLDIGGRFHPKAERYLIHLPFSIYTAWICVATIANIAALLTGVGWNGFGMDPVFWAIIMMLIATFLAIVFAIRNRDVYFGLVIQWALLGIALKRLETQTWGDNIIMAAGLFMLIILLIHLAQLFGKRVY